jgi:hypothetical protein
MSTRVPLYICTRAGFIEGVIDFFIANVLPHFPQRALLSYLQALQMEMWLPFNLLEDLALSPVILSDTFCFHDFEAHVSRNVNVED